jgi:hypothetical protein
MGQFTLPQGQQEISGVLPHDKRAWKRSGRREVKMWRGWLVECVRKAICLSFNMARLLYLSMKFSLMCIFFYSRQGGVWWPTWQNALLTQHAAQFFHLTQGRKEPESAAEAVTQVSCIILTSLVVTIPVLPPDEWEMGLSSEYYIYIFYHKLWNLSLV